MRLDAGHVFQGLMQAGDCLLVQLLLGDDGDGLRGVENRLVLLGQPNVAVDDDQLLLLRLLLVLRRLGQG